MFDIVSWRGHKFTCILEESLTSEELQADYYHLVGWRVVTLHPWIREPLTYSTIIDIRVMSHEIDPNREFDAIKNT